MKPIRAIAPFILAVMLPSLATAQAVSGGTNVGNGTGGNELVITGQSPQACVISGAAQSSVSNATVTTGAGAAQVVVGQLVDLNAVPLAARVSVALPVICNTANVVSISTSNGALTLENPAPAAPGFRSQLPYQLSATWAGQQETVNSGTPLTITSANAATGNLLLTIAIPAGGEPLIAGTYTDSVVVLLQPSS